MATNAPEPLENEPANKKPKTSEISAPITNLPSMNYPTSERFFHLLIRSKVDSIRPPDNKIFVAQRTDRVVDVWKGLVAHNFLSVPVLQKTKSKWYGFLDIWDIVKCAVDFFGVTDELKNTEDWLRIANAHEEFSKKVVKDIMKSPRTRRNPFFPIHSGFSLFSAIEAMAKERGLHRLPIIENDENRKLITMITQSHVIKLIAQNVDLLGARKNMPVSETTRFDEPVYTVHEDSVAMEAFKMMIEKEVSGLAVVDNDGKITGTISIRDLKALQVDGRMFWRLFQTVKNYLLKIRKENNELGGDRPRSVITVKGNETLENVIKKLSEHNIHRIFIVDDHKKPVGVISLKDVLYEIISG